MRKLNQRLAWKELALPHYLALGSDLHELIRRTREETSTMPPSPPTYFFPRSPTLEAALGKYSIETLAWSAYVSDALYTWGLDDPDQFETMGSPHPRELSRWMNVVDGFLLEGLQAETTPEGTPKYTAFADTGDAHLTIQEGELIAYLNAPNDFARSTIGIVSLPLIEKTQQLWGELERVLRTTPQSNEQTAQPRSTAETKALWGPITTTLQDYARQLSEQQGMPKPFDLAPYLM